MTTDILLYDEDDGDCLTLSAFMEKHPEADEAALRRLTLNGPTNSDVVSIGDEYRHGVTRVCCGAFDAADPDGHEHDCPTFCRRHRIVLDPERGCGECYADDRAEGGI